MEFKNYQWQFVETLKFFTKNIIILQNSLVEKHLWKKKYFTGVSFLTQDGRRKGKSFLKEMVTNAQFVEHQKGNFKFIINSITLLEDYKGMLTLGIMKKN
jgi:hypothetical protein